MVDGFEPTAWFSPLTAACTRVAVVQAADVGRGVYPGWWRTGVAGWVLYRVPSQDPPRTIFSHISASGPYPRPNEAIFSIFMRFLEIGSRMTSELTSELTQIDLQIDPPDQSPDGPQMALRPSYPDLRIPMVQNRAFLRFY